MREALSASIFSIILILIIYAIVHFKVKIITEEKFEEACEYGYFMGQYTAMKGDLRIDSLSLKWTKSPWLEEKPPIFEFGVSSLGQMAKKQIEIGSY